MSDNKELGKVKWFSALKGFGFINRLNDETDIFVHYTQINQEGFRTLNEGDEVSFVVFKTENGLQARDVKKVSTK